REPRFETERRRIERRKRARCEQVRGAGPSGADERERERERDERRPRIPIGARHQNLLSTANAIEAPPGSMLPPSFNLRFRWSGRLCSRAACSASSDEATWRRMIAPVA